MHNVDLSGLAKSLYERRHTGIIVPYQPHRVTGWMPSERWCHTNVHRFVRENVGCKAVGGWLVFNWVRRFTAYSVIEDANGWLFDITPSRASQRYPFVRHDGPEDEFEVLTHIMHLDYPNRD